MYEDVKLKTVFSAPGTPNRMDVDNTCSSPHKTVTTAQLQIGFCQTPWVSRNRGEAATTLENYGRAAGADLTNSGR